jgi:shikimate kinase
MIISLTGFMGCGKSSVGRKLSTLLSCSYIDLDSAIEDAVGRSIPEIFATDGEAGFRKMEKKILEDIVRKVSSDTILSLGGGTIMTAECADIVHERTVCIYLKATVDTLVKHLENESEGRPMLTGNDIRSRVTQLMDLRSSTYEKTAHITVDTDGRSVYDICLEIDSLLKDL